MTQGAAVVGRVMLAACVLGVIAAALQLNPDAWVHIKSGISLPSMTFLVALIALVITGAEYYRKKSIDRRESRPYVIAAIAPKEANQSLFELVIQNTGKTLARDVSISLSPDHRQHENASISMNKLGVLKNMGILTPRSIRRFYFGFYVDTSERASIKKQFSITARYTDVTGKHHYEDVFTSNPTDYEGMLQNSEKSLNDIHRVLEAFMRSHKEFVTHQKKLTETFVEHGVRIRNLHTVNLPSEELLNLAKNTFTDGSDKDGWLRPYVYDFILLVKQARDSLLQDSDLSVTARDVLTELNQILSHDWHHSDGKIEEHFKRLGEILSAKSL